MCDDTIAVLVPGTLHQTSEHKTLASSSLPLPVLMGHMSVTNTHPKSYREGNSGRVMKAKLPTPKTVPPLLSNSVRGMTSFHFSD